tara:strand:- start:217 stop:552 length:336 start_codon:yes stop_codon:yes gene_type:complete
MSEPADFVDAGALNEFPPGSAKVINHEGRDIALFNCAGDFYAIEDRCTHDDGTLADGDFNADIFTVTCPRHGAEFDVRTGCALTLPAYIPVDTFPVKVEAGHVWVSLPDPL